MLKWIDVIKFARYGNPEPAKRVEKTEEEWQQLLSPEQFRITRLKGTEPPYKNVYCTSYEPGMYTCICCGSILFDSHDKYYAISGWPSFTQPATKSAIKYEVDNSFNMKRVEVMCNVCDGHLGHVFPDGPEPGGLRYCINSESIQRIDDKKRLAIFGGGCFWCIEALMQAIQGVESVESGYSGGKRFNPSYKEVSSGLTGHAEVVRVKFDPEIISYEELLKIFFAIHDPTLLDPEDKQYNQYRSIIIYYNDDQKQIAEKIKLALAEQLEKTVHTEISPYKAFYPAEENHQDYYKKDPSKNYCQNIIDPKLEKLRKLLRDKMTNK